MTQTLKTRALSAWLFRVTLAAIISPTANANNADMTLTEAKIAIGAYRNLRESCAQGTSDERHACISQLSRANEQYRAAKELVMQHTNGPRNSTIASNSESLNR